MNAYELADKLMSSLTMEYDCDEYMKQSATMLRQQADELTEAGGMIGVLREKVSLQADYIAQLEKGLESVTEFSKALTERDK
jgi:hypothetical protein